MSATKGCPKTASRGVSSGGVGTGDEEDELELELEGLGDVVGEVDELVLELEVDELVADDVLDEDLVVVLLGGRVLVLVLVVGTAV